MSDEFKIEKGVPLSFRSGSGEKYPFKAMEIGDSFFVPVPDGATLTALQCRLSSNTARERPMKFACRQDKANNGVRVWRIA